MPTGLRSGRLVRGALLASLLASTLAIAQMPQKKAGPKDVFARRANELTLAGLRPGQDTLSRATGLYYAYTEGGPTNSPHDGQTVWLDSCRKQVLAIDFDSEKKIQVIRVSYTPWLLGDCAPLPPGPWKTGRGLRVGDPAAKGAQLYGEPDSRSPSTKDGQPLELWYYAFDWAGPDVPQVMEVLCTKEKDGQPGHVVEITLAAPSL